MIIDKGLMINEPPPNKSLNNHSSIINNHFRFWLYWPVFGKS